MYFIANWKMFGNLKSINTINSVINLAKLTKFRKAKIVYCPPYTILDKFVKKTKNTRISIGAQNCHHDKNFGPYTGSINAKMIKQTGAKYVILGHSENRQTGDTNKIINLKLKSSLSENLNVILCFGEKLAERKKKKTFQVIKKQINIGLKNVKNYKKIIFAYEPVWSIGSGKVLNNKDLEYQIKVIKNYIVKKFKIKNPRILYGGSVNPKNINSLVEIRFLKGFLIGSASQKSKKFIDIIKKSIN
tara:strand:+ start:6684 stop:7421 length:738 start_codon:yes stop_codon:yes gene_type:complete